MPYTTKYYWVADEFGYFVADFDTWQEMNAFIESSVEKLFAHRGNH